MKKSLISLLSLCLIVSMISAGHAERRFMDNGDGTITDTKLGIMWQRSDNGKTVSFEAARDYCKTLRLGGYSDWRLPSPHEHDTEAVLELLTLEKPRDVHSRFDLYWSSDPGMLLPFNYHPSRGMPVQSAYPARENERAYTRAVRSLKGTTR